MNERPEIQNPFTNSRVVAVQFDPEAYHKNEVPRGHSKFVMSRSELMEFATCPARWMSGYKDDDTKSTEWGTIMDVMFLDANRVSERLAVAPETYPDSKTGLPKPWNWNATYCDEWRNKRAGKVVVKHERHKDAEAALKALLADPDIAKIAYESAKQVYVVADYKDRATGITVQVKSLIDIVPFKDCTRFGKCLGDFKTCSDAEPRKYVRSINDYYYNVQAALNLDIYCAATGEDRCSFFNILQENFSPWQVGKRFISPTFIDLGRAKYTHALHLYCRCLSDGYWPGYEYDQLRPVIDGFQIAEPEVYMLNQ